MKFDRNLKSMFINKFMLQTVLMDSFIYKQNFDKKMYYAMLKYKFIKFGTCVSNFNCFLIKIQIMIVTKEGKL